MLVEGRDYNDGLVQERRISSALAMELRLYCTNPSNCDSLQWRQSSIMTSQSTVNSAVCSIVYYANIYRKKIKLHIVRPLWGESNAHQWIPLAIKAFFFL